MSTEVFAVAGVAVEKTAADARAARAAALAEGQRKAFARLVRRLVPKIDQSRVPQLEDEDITPLVQSFEIADERVGPNRYVASVTFRFNPAAVGNLLRAYDVSYAESVAPPILVLPVYKVEGRTLLWGDDNLWHGAWAALAAGDGLREIVVPLGDLSDIMTFGAVDLARPESAAGIADLAGRYDSGEVVVVEAALEVGPPPQVPVVSVVMRSPAANGTRSRRVSYRGYAEQSIGVLLALAAEATQVRIEEEWKVANLLRFDNVETIEIDIPFGDLADWLDIRRRVTGLALVREFEIDQLSPRFARGVLRYLGDRAQLDAALANNGLSLEREANFWLLRRFNGSGLKAGTTSASPRKLVAE